MTLKYTFFITLELDRCEIYIYLFNFRSLYDYMKDIIKLLCNFLSRYYLPTSLFKYLTFKRKYGK